MPEVMAQDSKVAFENKAKDLESKFVNNKALVKKVASMDPIAAAFDISEIAINAKFDLKTIAKIYFEVGTEFAFKWLRSQLHNISPKDDWERISIKTITEDLYSYQMRISSKIVANMCDAKDGVCSIDSVARWGESDKFLLERYRDFIKEIRLGTVNEVSTFVIALNRLRPLAS